MATENKKSSHLTSKNIESILLITFLLINPRIMVSVLTCLRSYNCYCHHKIIVIANKYFSSPQNLWFLQRDPSSDCGGDAKESRQGEEPGSLSFLRYDATLRLLFNRKHTAV